FFPTVVHKEYFRLSRAVATCKISSSLQYDAHQQVLIINTHFLFHHDSTLSIVTGKRLQHVQCLLDSPRLNSKRGHVYQFLKPQGFVLTTLLIDGSMCVSFSSSDWQLGFPTAVHKEYFRLSRAVATRKISSSLQYDAHQQVLIINTHFLFHHDLTLSMVTGKRLQHVQCFNL
ncbi:hypothetical protein DY000_02024776, partial [Brassica cretica]